jgi:hypothetical protein
MRGVVGVFATMLAISVGACSIYPLPEDAMSFDSNQITAIIRCQTRDAIRHVIIEVIEPSGDRVVYQRAKGEWFTGTEMVAWLRQSPENFRSIQWERFRPDLSAQFLYYKDTSVSYDFSIDSTEANTAGVNLTLLQKLLGGTDNIGIVARNDRTREVKRHFRVYDSFDSLSRLMEERVCERAPDYINQLYPSTGLIRIYSLVKGFIEANQWNNLAGDDTNYTTAQMADTITFTTKFTGNLDPSTTMDPVRGKWVPSSLSANLDNTRQDLHTILILLRLPPSKKGLPRFDEFGRITLSAKENQRATAATALDRQKDYNTQDALTRLGTGIGQIKQ